MRRYTQPFEKMEIKCLARLVIVLLVWYPITYLNKLTPIQIPNSYLLLLVGSLIPYTLATVLIFGFVDEVCLKLNLYEKLFNDGRLHSSTEKLISENRKKPKTERETEQSDEP